MILFCMISSKRYVLTLNKRHLTLGPSALLIAAAVFLAFGPWPQSAVLAKTAVGTASGTVVINGKALPLRYSYGMLQPNTFDAGKKDTAVLLTETPLPEGALEGLIDLKTATRNQHNWAYFKIDNAGRPIYEAIDHPSTREGRYSQIQMSGFTHAAFAPKKMAGDRVEGSFSTSGPEDFMGYTYEINVAFSAPLVTAVLPDPLPDAKTGKALPADGGEPGKAYRAYRKAIEDRDIRALRGMAPQTRDMSDDELKDMMEFVEAIAPGQPRIARGYVRGDRAVLHVEEVVEGTRRYGTVEVRATGKTWYVVDESWGDRPPGK